ncbi:hypothetical protein CUZ56_02291 [Saezia sanguinis]|jgi:hypothetical protein|uniref:Uncharacterized protein n=1 Tax=Saezia sanguinis TaxID=1965230 RepID=A0A433SBU6_9BURK|nr:hypothetical protein [Saezia sanguinis]RUS66212.1 hypothetical protein CUZ56_02291 [Saezia sanguinis]
MSDQVQLGKYCISPLIRQLPDGSYSSSVSIRAGHGSTSLDRIVRFVHRFTDEQAAKVYATKEGIAWVKDPLRHRRGW